MCTNFQTKRRTLNFWTQICPKMHFGVEISNSGFGINTFNIPYVPIFSQNGQLLILWSKFGEIAQLRAIFWFKYCWRCCRELGGGWNELGGGGWSWVEAEMSWVEVDGAGWRWVHGLVILKEFCLLSKYWSFLKQKSCKSWIEIKQSKHMFTGKRQRSHPF